MNKTLRLFFLLLVCTMCSASLAQEPLPPTPLLSKVESLFVREHEGLFIESRLLTRARHNKEVWALVRFDAMVHGRTGSELMRVPAEVELRTGDIVEVSLAEPKTITSVGPIRIAGRVIKRVATDTQLAAQPAVQLSGN